MPWGTEIVHVVHPPKEFGSVPVDSLINAVARWQVAKGRAGVLGRFGVCW